MDERALNRGSDGPVGWLPVIRHWCLGAIALSVLGILAIVESAPTPGLAVQVREGDATTWAWMWLVVWAAASVAYAVTVALGGARLVRVKLRAARATGVPGWWPAGQTLLRELGKEAREQSVLVLPLIVAIGPLLLLRVMGALTDSHLVVGSQLAIGLGLALWLLRFVREILSELRSVVSIVAFVLAVAGWELVASALAGMFQWPAPDAAYFQLAAQLNVALLIAGGLVFAVPPAWAGKTAFTWLSSAVVVAVVGLLAAIAGALGSGDPGVLFILSLSPIPPVVLAFLLEAHEQLAPRGPANSPES